MWACAYIRSRGYDKLIYSDVAARRVNQNTLRLSWSASSLEDNLNGKHVAKWILLAKSFRLSYRTSFSFAVQRDEDRELAGKIIHPRKHHRDQNSIAIILEHHSVNNVKKFRLWLTNSGCNTHKCCPITVTAENLFQLFSVDCSEVLLALTWSVKNAHLSSITCTNNSAMANCWVQILTTINLFRNVQVVH